MPSSWPISVVARGLVAPVAVGSVLWRMGGVSRATVIVKATFGFVYDGVARLLPPREILREDRGHEAAAETAPFLPCAGVILTGHACAPGAKPAPSRAVRLALYREHALLDKTLHVFGDRAAPGAPPQPFLRIPLGWERAFGGPGCHDNPAGVGFARGPSRAQPNVVDPADARRPAGFGPIPRPWRPRRRLIGALDPFFDGPPGGASLDIPDGTDLRFYQPAPADQQTDYLRGDEWIILDGLHPVASRARTRLPSARAEARRYPASGPPQPIELTADTLVIDADQQVCSVIWRGCFRLDEAPEHACVHAGLALPGHAVAWVEGPAPAVATTVTPAVTTAGATASPAARVPVLAAPVVIALAALGGAGDLLSDDPGGGATGRIVLSHVARSVMPFPATAAAAAPRGALPEGVLPFKPAAEEAGPAPIPPRPAPPPRVRTLTDALDDEDDRTGAVDLRAGKGLPFAHVAAPEGRPAAPYVPLPGAPWSGPAPAPARPAEVEVASTMEIRLPPAPPPIALPPIALPPIVPPPIALPDPPHVASPSTAPPDPPRAAPPPPAPPAPAAPAHPASALRDKVIAALAARRRCAGSTCAGPISGASTGAAPRWRAASWRAPISAEATSRTRASPTPISPGPTSPARISPAPISPAPTCHAPRSRRRSSRTPRSPAPTSRRRAGRARASPAPRGTGRASPAAPGTAPTSSAWRRSGPTSRARRSPARASTAPR